MKRLHLSCALLCALVFPPFAGAQEEEGADDTTGLVSSSFGLWQGAKAGESAELVDEERFRYLNLQFQGDRLVGASSLGLTEHVGVLRGLIQSGKGLGIWKDRLLRDPTRIMEAYLGAVQGAG
mgnify:CR=1 FL=1